MKHQSMPQQLHPYQMMTMISKITKRDLNQNRNQRKPLEKIFP